jgi:hypothetical protein
MAKSVSRCWAVLVAVLAGLLTRGELAAQEGDQAAWQSATTQNNEGAYREFLRIYPESVHSEEAFRRLIDLLVAKDAPAFANAFKDDVLAEGIVPGSLPY